MKKMKLQSRPVLRSRIIFMRLRRLRLRLLPYCIARQIENELKLKQMLKLSCAFDSVRFILIKYNWMGYKLVYFVFVFNYQPCLIPISEPEPSVPEPEPSVPEPEPHRVTAPAPTKICGSLRLRLRNAGLGHSYTDHVQYSNYRRKDEDKNTLNF
jgi:hypothetical protein